MTKLKELHAQRAQESLKPLFNKGEGLHLLFLTSSTDQGVVRNNGRNGARLAPRSFLFQFKKMTQDHELKNWRFSEREVSSEELEKAHFFEAQKSEAKKIAEASPFSHQFICHVGGGHDHIYPLVTALKKDFSKVLIINIDAHADTRTDQEFHSGTPFRQLDQEIDDFKVFQIGLHPYANSFSTLAPLSQEMPILWKEEMDTPQSEAFFESIRKEITSDTLVIFSLDADALAGYLVPGVSAVNADGLNLDQLKRLMKHYLSLEIKHPPVLGIYELNPVYDQLSGVSMNTMANFLFHTLKTFKESP